MTLSIREQQIQQLIDNGKSAKEIAAHLQIGVKAVESHLARIKRKLAQNSGRTPACVASAESVAHDSTQGVPAGVPGERKLASVVCADECRELDLRDGIVLIGRKWMQISKHSLPGAKC